MTEIVDVLVGESGSFAIARRLQAFTALALILVMTGCGGAGGASPSSSSSATSRAREDVQGQASASTLTTQAGQPATTGTSASQLSTTTSATTNTSPIIEAKSICARRNRELMASVPARPTLEQIASSATRRADIQRRALGELAQLTPPANLASAWRATISASGVVLRTTEELGKFKKPASAASLRREAALVNKPQVGLLFAAKRAGLQGCSVVSQPSLPGL